MPDAVTLGRLQPGRADSQDMISLIFRLWALRRLWQMFRGRRNTYPTGRR
jgi:hypothetical protein